MSVSSATEWCFFCTTNRDFAFYILWSFNCFPPCFGYEKTKNQSVQYFRVCIFCVMTLLSFSHRSDHTSYISVMHVSLYVVVASHTFS